VEFLSEVTALLLVAGITLAVSTRPAGTEAKDTQGAQRTAGVRRTR
tara:strand:+ start:1152 stop:1289 length:138 start_codon:yes stop_codon:yes gene_type:complete